jgi:hypothetical protein
MDGGSIPPGSTIHSPPVSDGAAVRAGLRRDNCCVSGLGAVSCAPLREHFLPILAQGDFSLMTRIEVPNSAGRRRRPTGRFGRWVMILLLLIILGTGLWTWLTLGWAYAEGERAGVLQKFVRRGWVCKTREGEIALYYGGGQYMGAGISPQLWDFSVRDSAVAADLSKAVGHRVQLHYTEHPGIPTSCFAETRYLVDRVTVTDNAPANQAPTGPSPGTSGGPAGQLMPGAPSSTPAQGPTSR